MVNFTIPYLSSYNREESDYCLDLQLLMNHVVLICVFHDPVRSGGVSREREATIASTAAAGVNMMYTLQWRWRLPAGGDVAAAAAGTNSLSQGKMGEMCRSGRVRRRKSVGEAGTCLGN